MDARMLVIEPHPNQPGVFVATAVGGHHDGECARMGSHAEVLEWVTTYGGVPYTDLCHPSTAS